jgi:conjugative transfer region protein TrbK
MRSLNPKGWGAVAAIIVLMAVALAAANTASRHARTSARSSAAADQLSLELNRCRSLGEQAENDPGCKATWERARQHFFGDDKAAQP